jgi:hypothetical protein
VYWREDEILTRAGHDLANDLPANADHPAIAAYLRARKLQIVCGRNTVTIKNDDPGAAPRAHTTNPPPAAKIASVGVNVSEPDRYRNPTRAAG